MKHRFKRDFIDEMWRRGMYDSLKAEQIYTHETEESICVEDLLEREWEPDPQVQKEIQVVPLKSEEWPDGNHGSWLGIMVDYAEMFYYTTQILNDNDKKRRNREHQRRHTMLVKEGQKIKKVEGEIIGEKVVVGTGKDGSKIWARDISHIFVKDLKVLLDDSPDGGIVQIKSGNNWWNLYYENIRVVVKGRANITLVPVKESDV